MKVVIKKSVIVPFLFFQDAETNIITAPHGDRIAQVHTGTTATGWANTALKHVESVIKHLRKSKLIFSAAEKRREEYEETTRRNSKLLKMDVITILILWFLDHT